MDYTRSEYGADSDLTTIKSRAQQRYKKLRSKRYFWLCPLACGLLVIAAVIAFTVLLPFLFQKPLPEKVTIAFSSAVRENQTLKAERADVLTMIDVWRNGSESLIVRLQPYSNVIGHRTKDYLLPLEAEMLIPVVNKLFAEPVILKDDQDPSQESALEGLLPKTKRVKRSATRTDSKKLERLVFLPPPSNVYRSKETFLKDVARANDQLKSVSNSGKVHLLVRDKENEELYKLPKEMVFTNPEELANEIDIEIKKENTSTAAPPTKASPIRTTEEPETIPTIVSTTTDPSTKASSAPTASTVQTSSTASVTTSRASATTSIPEGTTSTAPITTSTVPVTRGTDSSPTVSTSISAQNTKTTVSKSTSTATVTNTRETISTVAPTTSSSSIATSPTSDSTSTAHVTTTTTIAPTASTDSETTFTVPITTSTTPATRSTTFVTSPSTTTTTTVVPATTSTVSTKTDFATTAVTFSSTAASTEPVTTTTATGNTTTAPSTTSTPSSEPTTTSNPFTSTYHTTTASTPLTASTRRATAATTTNGATVPETRNPNFKE